MTRIMICGTRKAEDINLLTEAGVDAIGLITEVWQDIPCNLSRAEARRLNQLIPPLISSVLIVTEEKVDEICRLVECVLPHILQLHGFNTAEDVAVIKGKLSTRIIKTLHFHGERMAEGDDPIGCAREYVAAGANAILVDSYQEDKVGATGEIMDLDLARKVRDGIYPVPLILAGGLNLENILQAIEKVKPYAVDVFSGVTGSGHLDADKVRSFVSAIRQSWKGDVP
jgi:phosphoribosylanthranilate isomerase